MEYEFGLEVSGPMTQLEAEIWIQKMEDHFGSNLISRKYEVEHALQYFTHSAAIWWKMHHAIQGFSGRNTGEFKKTLLRSRLIQKCYDNPKEKTCACKICGEIGHTQEEHKDVCTHCEENHPVEECPSSQVVKQQKDAVKETLKKKILEELVMIENIEDPDGQGLVKHFHMVQTQLEQISNVQKDLLANNAKQVDTQAYGIKTRGGTHTPDPLYPEGHPKRIEQDSQLQEEDIDSSPKKKKKHKEADNSNDPIIDEVPIVDPNSISISDAETKDGAESDKDNEKIDPPEIRQEEAPNKRKRYTREDFVTRKLGKQRETWVQKSMPFPGICEDVPVEVANCLILTDFVVLDMPKDGNMSIILGRPFLNTAGAIIDCNKGKVTFTVNEKEQTVYFPKKIDKRHGLNSIENIETVKAKTLSSRCPDLAASLPPRRPSPSPAAPCLPGRPASPPSPRISPASPRRPRRPASPPVAPVVPCLPRRPDPADSSPPTPGAWPPPTVPFYSYASSSSTYSPHSPTLAHAHAQNQLLAHGMPVGAQSQNFALSLSSSSSNPPPQQRRHLAGATGPYGPFTGYAAVLGRSRFLGPAQKLLEEICDVGGRPSQLDRCSDDGLLDLDAMDAVADVGHEMDSSDHAAADGGTVSGAEQQWRKTRLISLMEEFQMLDREVQRIAGPLSTCEGNLSIAIHKNMFPELTCEGSKQKDFTPMEP
ncbi:hypothetical protein ZWY2020_059221 [Hordeum vulgare]|nr:hypothetical protein ZWY2020_059221 [Hordeum vulgare]